MTDGLSRRQHSSNITSQRLFPFSPTSGKAYQGRNNSPLINHRPILLHHQDRRLRHPMLVPCFIRDGHVEESAPLQVAGEQVLRIHDGVAGVACLGAYSSEMCFDFRGDDEGSAVRGYDVAFDFVQLLEREGAEGTPVAAVVLSSLSDKVKIAGMEVAESTYRRQRRNRRI